MLVSINNRVVDYWSPMYAGRTVMLGIDSSKTNTGITVGDCNGNILDIIEINGSDDGTSEKETLILCKKQRECVRTILDGAKVYAVGIENIITTENTQVLNTHMSRFKITNVFASYICAIQDTFNITPYLINNQEWKASILPEQFRAREYKKGSLAYFQSIRSKYANYSDDATDSICIYKHLCKLLKVAEGYAIEAKEVKRRDFMCVLGPMSMYNALVGQGATKFIINTELSVHDNAVCMANRNKSNISVGIVNTADLSLDDIYKFCAGSFKESEKELVLIVKAR